MRFVDIDQLKFTNGREYVPTGEYISRSELEAAVLPPDNSKSKLINADSFKDRLIAVAPPAAQDIANTICAVVDMMPAADAGQKDEYPRIVYVVTSGEYSDYHIDGVFTDRDKAEAEPVKHGRWVNDKGLYKCTACNDLCTVAGWANCIPEEQMYKVFKHCPHCGAKMDK